MRSVLLAAAVGMMPGALRANTVLDYSQQYGTIAANFPWGAGESFTVGADQYLSQIAFYYVTTPATTFHISPWNGSTLGSSVFDAAVPAVSGQTLTFSTGELPLVAGGTYLAYFSSPSLVFGVSYGQYPTRGTDYPGGSLMVSSTDGRWRTFAIPTDVTFRAEFVSPQAVTAPLPMAVALGMPLLGLLGLVQRVKARRGGS